MTSKDTDKSQDESKEASSNEHSQATSNDKPQSLTKDQIRQQAIKQKMEEYIEKKLGRRSSKQNDNKQDQIAAKEPRKEENDDESDEDEFMEHADFNILELDDDEDDEDYEQELLFQQQQQQDAQQENSKSQPNNCSIVENPNGKHMRRTILLSINHPLPGKLQTTLEQQYPPKESIQGVKTTRSGRASSLKLLKQHPEQQQHKQYKQQQQLSQTTEKANTKDSQKRQVIKMAKQQQLNSQQLQKKQQQLPNKQQSQSQQQQQPLTKKKPLIFSRLRFAQDGQDNIRTQSLPNLDSFYHTDMFPNLHCLSQNIPLYHYHHQYSYSFPEIHADNLSLFNEQYQEYGTSQESFQDKQMQENRNNNIENGFESDSQCEDCLCEACCEAASENYNQSKGNKKNKVNNNNKKQNENQGSKSNDSAAQGNNKKIKQPGSQQQNQQINIVFAPEIKHVLDHLDGLDFAEKRRATAMRESDFHAAMEDFVDCIGCKESLQKFLNELFGQDQQLQKTMNLDGIMLTRNREIGVIESLLENNFNIASFLQFHLNKAAALDNLNKDFNLSRKSLAKKHFRCTLHSKKTIPCTAATTTKKQEFG